MKKKLQNQIIRLIPILFFSVIAYYIFDHNESLIARLLGKNTSTVEAQPVGRTAFDFTIEKKNVYAPKAFQLSSLKGFPVVLHFWATWCGPCYEELPELISLSQKLRPLGYSFVAVSLDSSWAAVDSYFERNPQFKAMRDTMILLLDPDNALARSYNIGGVPETFLINQEFLVDNKFVGPQNWSSNEMKPYLDSLKKPRAQHE